MSNGWRILDQRGAARRRGAPSGPAQSHRTQYTRDRARRETQQMVRDYPLAKTIQSRLIQVLIGRHGPNVQCRSDDAAFNETAEKIWRGWWHGMPGERSADLRAFSTGPRLLEHIVTGWCQDGATTALFVHRGDDLPGGVQLIEDERVRNPSGIPDHQDIEGGMIGGLETDGAGRVEKVHIASYASSSGWRSGVTTDTDARDARFVVYSPQPLEREANLLRPMPMLMPLLAVMPELQSYIESVGEAALVQSSQGVFIRTADAVGARQALGVTESGPLGEHDEPAETRDYDQMELDPGFVHTIGRDDNVEAFNPTQPQQQFNDFVRTQIRLASSVVNLPLEWVLFDVAGVNWSSSKYLGAMVRRAFAPLEASIEAIIARCWAFRMNEAYALGELVGPRPAGWDRIECVHERLPDADPLKTYQAMAYAAERGLLDYTAISAELGRDEPELAEKIGRDRERREELGAMPIIAGANGDTGRAAGEQTREPDQVGGGAPADQPGV